MQAQQTVSLPKWSLSKMVAIVATVIAAALAVALVVTAARPVAPAFPAVVSLHDVAAEQIGHNRSEEGLGALASVGGEQVAHNRSEEGLSDR